MSTPRNTGRPTSSRTRRGATLPVRPIEEWHRRSRRMFAAALAVALVEANVSVETLARSIDATPRAVHHWLNGTRACSLARLCQMAAALGVPADHLLL